MNLKQYHKRLVARPEAYVFDAIRDTLPFVYAEQVAEGNIDIRFYPTWVRLLDSLPLNVREEAESDPEVLEAMMARAEVVFEQTKTWFESRASRRQV